MLLGASSIKQLEENLVCLKVVDLLTKEILEEIEKILKNRPETDINIKGMCMFAPRR